jgi:hypothetical protein
MMRYFLHNPASQAHLEDLKDRLGRSLADVVPRPYNPTRADALIVTITEVVRAMDEGVLTVDDVRAVLSSFDLAGFSIDRWVAEMVDEGVYLEDALARAA